MQRFRWLAVRTFLGLLLATPGHTWARAETTFAAVLDAQMPWLLARYAVPGAVVAYIQDGAVAWTRAYGLADLATGTPMQPDLVFNHGSDGKVLTAWGVMRLVELGLVDLDAPVNRYLKRWQLPSNEFDPDQVTLRRLLSHTAGLSVHGYSDYGPRRRLPTLVQVLEGQNQLDGAVVIGWKPGTRFEYSGGGFAVLQLVIEDVTGESFAAFMQREVTDPLGMSSLRWAWTPELVAQAPKPYGLEHEPLEYRQLASQAVGSELSTVADFARFVAAAVTGPGGEPAGRGVLEPDTVQQMTTVQSHTNGTAGLGYGIGSSGANQLLMHFGSNPGWSAHFVIATQRREGLVIANNSSRGHPLNLAVHLLWLNVVLGEPGQPAPQPVAASLGLVATVALALAGLLALGLLVSVAIVVYQWRRGGRSWAVPRAARQWWPVLAWGMLALLWWYWFYSPLPLRLPATFPDLWWLPQIGYVMDILLAWVVFSGLAACLPHTVRPLEPAGAPAVRAAQTLQ